MARILIIEDDEDIADLYRMSLERSGHEIVGLFDDPREVLTGWDHSLDPVDVVILDERLGDLSGTSFLGQLKLRFPHSQFVLATADPDAALAAEHAHTVMRKPFPMRRLSEIVGLLLEKKG